jgi:hypothetical protein
MTERRAPYRPDYSAALLLSLLLIAASPAPEPPYAVLDCDSWQVITYCPPGNFCTIDTEQWQVNNEIHYAEPGDSELKTWYSGALWDFQVADDGTHIWTSPVVWIDVMRADQDSIQVTGHMWFYEKWGYNYILAPSYSSCTIVSVYAVYLPTIIGTGREWLP